MTAYFLMNFYVFMITILGLILPALIIYFYASKKNIVPLIISIVFLAGIAYLAGNSSVVLLPFILPIIISGIAGSYLRRTGEKFWSGLGYTIAAELFGIMLGTIILYFAYGKQDIAQLIAQSFNDAYMSLPQDDIIYNAQLNLMVSIMQMASQGAAAPISDIQAMTMAEKLAIIVPQIKSSMANYLPSMIMGYGIISGIFAWFFSSLMLASSKRHGKELKGTKNFEAPPMFSTWKSPRWITNILMIMLLASYIVPFIADGKIISVAIALRAVSMLIISIQGLAVINWWIKKKLGTVGATIICVIVVLLLNFILPWVGIFDIIFSIRTMSKRKKILKMRMDEIQRQVNDQMKDKIEQDKKKSKENKKETDSDDDNKNNDEKSDNTQNEDQVDIKEDNESEDK
jgi:hypothetical protein